MNWEYFDKPEFNDVNATYLPDMGEGETMATQIVTAVNKLIYKWYNDGDVYDNTGSLTGWANDLSSYANWLHQHTGADTILERIFKCRNDEDYENLLVDLADYTLRKEYLAAYANQPKLGTIYESYGPFEFIELSEDDEEEDW